MHCSFADIWLALGILDFFPEPLELPAADIFQVDAIRARCGGLVKKYRYVVTRPDFFSNPPRQGYAIFYACAFDGNEWHYVGGPDARMRSRVLRQVDQFRSLADTQERRFTHAVRLPRERNHATIVVGIHLAIQDIHARHAAHGGNDGVHFGRVAPFREIWDALNESLHLTQVLNPWNTIIIGDFRAASYLRKRGVALRRKNDLSLLDGHAALVHTEVVGNFAVIVHFKNAKVGLFSGFQ